MHSRGAKGEWLAQPPADLGTLSLNLFTWKSSSELGGTLGPGSELHSEIYPVDSLGPSARASVQRANPQTQPLLRAFLVAPHRFARPPVLSHSRVLRTCQ